MPPPPRRRKKPSRLSLLLQAVSCHTDEVPQRIVALPGDIQAFLDNYPGAPDDLRRNDNLEFYLNERRCRPDCLLISDIHGHWYGDYYALEENHGYIQWLFPLREYGMNYESQTLYAHEISAMRADPTICERIIASYRLMLDFYGMRLISAETGLIERCGSGRLCADRYKNLLSSPHNNLRITRILKCLSEFGFERLNAGFILHVLNEQSESRKLRSNILRRSLDRWWANCLRNKDERKAIAKIIRKVRERKSGFVFTRAMYEDALERRRRTGKLKF